MKILVTGSRDWNNAEHVVIMAEALKEFKAVPSVHDTDPDPIDVTLILDDSKGAASMAAYGGTRLGYGIDKHPIPWNRRGAYYDRGAAYKNNDAMVAVGADLCLVFVVRDAANNMDKGSHHLAEQALKANIPCRIYESNGSCTVVMPEADAIAANPYVGVDGVDAWA